MEAPVESPSKENWRELVPHEAGRLILNHMAFARHLVWLERRDGLPRIVIRDRKAAKNTPSPSTRKPIRSASRVRRTTTRMSSVSLYLDDHAEPGLRL